MITIHTAVYNEEAKIQFMIDHYKTRFPSCNIIVYDNESQDSTIDIAKKNGCIIRPHNTGGRHNDELLLTLKNNCWKTAPTDWVMICDPDELMDINEQQLNEEAAIGTTIIKTCGYNIVDMGDNYLEDPVLNLAALKYGRRSEAYDKCMLFNKKHLSEINYNHGGHIANPVGKTQYNKNIYNMYHYHFVNFTFVFNRYQMTVKRFSDLNIKYGWGIHCFKQYDELKNTFEILRKDAVRIVP